MNPRRRNRVLSVLFLSTSIAALLAAGAVQARIRFLSRGISQPLPGPIAHGGVQPGINVYLHQYDESHLVENLSRIRAAGFAAVKQPFFFKESFDWQTTDAILSAVRESGLSLVPLLDGDPANDFAPPPDPAQFAQWAGEFAKRYGHQVDYYIVWDEPNLTSHWGGRPVNAAEYVALLSATASAIRGEDATSFIIAAPLAPTVETGPENLSDPVYLQAMYESGAAGAFDVVAAKPYGFDSDPDDRVVSQDVLNFSRVILLREVMVRNGDDHLAIWAGNWGWNSLPTDWQGPPSIWGQVDRTNQTEWTVSAFERAREEWPWMGYMFLENWQPFRPPDDPWWGFSIANRPVVDSMRAHLDQDDVSYPGFHLARLGGPGQGYQGDWRFSPEFGADIGKSGDSVTLRFWGTDVGLRVRRADFRARLYATVDGEPANALPRDERGSTLVLTSADPAEDYVALEPIAEDLAAGEHTLTLVAERGWEQWALHGFSVGYSPPSGEQRWLFAALGLLALAGLVAGVWIGRWAEWRALALSLAGRFREQNWPRQILVTGVLATLVGISGWLTWGVQSAGVYRRLGDAGQLALTAAAASIFYVAPSFLVYAAALVLLFFLILARPAWGIALVAFAFPFYVKPKPMLGYLFSPVELFLLVTTVATLFIVAGRFSSARAAGTRAFRRLHFMPLDYAVLSLAAVATLSLLFTERLDVATNEWRVVIVEPVLFYFLLRLHRIGKSEMWVILDAFVAGGLVVALIGLGQLVLGENLITAEGGLLRVRSIYGSPNNVALYLGRIVPIATAMALMGLGRRRWLYALAMVPLGAATALTYSKGALFLGLPAALLVVGWYWLSHSRRRKWPWLLLAGVLALVVLVVVLQVPELADRLNPQGETGFVRANLWRASINMFREHPLTGVGLDNFLYAYRGRYIFDAAWREPDLSHPHNLVLDFATRLGLLGLAAGVALLGSFFLLTLRLPGRVSGEWRPVTVGIIGAMVNMLAHGLVDHSFFLVDLAYAFFLLVGLAAWLRSYGRVDP